ncbi:uncharacterized protein LOC126681580 [Mercurialis annua]|uniref:uncharacterized protein LOC126681580 n=1 Tax=Mercurialis annua TaxID=3986 RepID=UPI00215F4DC8|nr:uncharacterized protein LOC126681580 [Mercurialis annua]
MDKNAEGSGVVSVSENVKLKEKMREGSDVKRRRLAFDVAAVNKKIQKALTIEELVRYVMFKFIEDNKKILSNTQLELFRNTFLGKFLDLKPMSVQPQLLHSVLLREVKHPNNRELWFKVVGYKLRFSIEEFALIMGLNCVGELDNLFFAPTRNRMVETYFPNSDVTRDGLGVIFFNKSFKSDDDAVKLAVIYLFEFLLCSSESKFQNVSRFFMDMVDSVDYNSYPWGIMIFRSTIADLNNRFVSSKKLKFYRLFSFPLALQL